PLREGRGIEERDTTDSEKVILVNETLARRFFAGRSPLGQMVRVGGPASRRIVGIYADILNSGLDRAASPETLVPLSQRPTDVRLQLVVRTEFEEEPARVLLRTAMRASFPEFPFEIRTMRQTMSVHFERPRLLSVLLLVFAGIAVTLASLG